MTDLAFLHTAQSNADLFEDLLAGSALTRSHMVRDDLRQRALVAEGLTPEVQTETEAALRHLVESARAVILTCSTLGPAADDLAGLPVVRIDRTLARAAVQAGGRVGVFCTARSTLEPTRALFAEEAARTGAEITLRLVAEDAWADFLDGRTDHYAAAVATEVDTMAGDFDVVALAQCSMAPARDLCTAVRPLTSPDLGLAAALKLLDENGSGPVG